MEGRGLSDAMAKQPADFLGSLHQHGARGRTERRAGGCAAPHGGSLHAFAEVQAKFKSALIYPAFVLVVGIGIAIFFMTFMLPNFMKLFEGFKVPLPLATRMLIGYQQRHQTLVVADARGDLRPWHAVQSIRTPAKTASARSMNGRLPRRFSAK